ncbi:MAG: hypothetical protein FJX77_10165, partial [Armatimonadetes bacterium]|nr:hypothetical protein [Armatimonadota bacterium]
MSRTFPLRTLGLLLLGGSLLATRPSGAQQVVQRLLPGPSQRQTLQTRHFTISFDPTRLSREQAEEAGQLAEKGWDHCAVRFGTTAPESIRLDLSPNFTGATGFAVLGDPRGRTPQAR